MATDHADPTSDQKKQRRSQILLLLSLLIWLPLFAVGMMPEVRGPGEGSSTGALYMALLVLAAGLSLHSVYERTA